MPEADSSQEIIDELECFLADFKKYAAAVYANKPNRDLDSIASPLRRREPKITHLLLRIIGDGHVNVPYTISFRNLLACALMNAAPHNFKDIEGPVYNVLDKAIGTVDAGLWPPATPAPVLLIQDANLRQRCGDLLKAPGNYDRVLREATTVLEERMRQRVPFEVLSRTIPNSGDRIGDNLVNKLFAPNAPILSISSDKNKRVAIHRMLLGVTSYLRNHYHHCLDPQTELSWAWSAVGLVDRLLIDIASCTVEGVNS